MLTQCPSCQTVFRVTSAILRAAHGTVRCGRCETQFDAIEQLLDGEDAINLNAAEHAGAASSEAAAEQTAPLSHEEIVLEGNRIEISGVYQRVDAEDATTRATHAHTIIEEFNIDTEAWENPFLAAQTGDVEVGNIDPDEAEVADVEQALNEKSLAEAMASLDSTALSDAAATNESLDKVSVRPAHPTPPLALSNLDNDEARLFDLPKPVRRWPWFIAATAFSVLLIAQVLHHARETLARHPTFGPQLTRLYAAIGMPLEPQWQLQAYNIKQWGIVADPQDRGTLRVRASVTNGAPFAQPYPLLQLSLEDRFGGQVGARAFTPQEYLGNAAQATRLLAAGEAANVDLAIVDPGHDAVGFQFDTCLQLHGGLQCTHQQTNL